MLAAEAYYEGVGQNWERAAMIKARQIAEEKQAVEQYGSSDSGASLGDILGAALSRNN